MTSCTTNCIVPLLKLLDEKYSVVSSNFLTVHAATASQNVIDGVHLKNRSHRSIFNNIIPHTTGASKSATKILPNLKENIIDKFFVTPNYFESDLNSFKGSGFGIQPIFRQSAYFRYSNKSNELNNLYFVGAGSHPGAGVPGVISSAKVTEKLILKYHG